jgi:hypothetical protein
MRLSIFVFAVALLASGTDLRAQDEAPTKIVISYYQCDWNDAFPFIQSLDSLSKPVWQELVDEGKISGWGTLVHDFAGYENVLTWRAGTSLANVEEAQEEAGRRLSERHPDAPAATCVNHRDGIYQLGPSTGPNKPGYEHIVVSYNTCDNNLRDDIAASVDSLMLPIAQELVDEGVFGQWGILLHDWAGRENVINYRSAKDRTSFFEGWAELNKRMDERHPDATPYYGCNQHRDGLYIEGPRTWAPGTDLGESE